MTDHTVVDLLPRNAIPSIDDPTFEAGSDEGVIVIEGNSSARAYPTRILQNHEVPGRPCCWHRGRTGYLNRCHAYQGPWN